MIRLSYFLHRTANLSLEEFQAYWRDVHGPLVARYAKALRIRRYIQAHVRPDDPMTAALQQTYGLGPETYDGVAELWFASPRDLMETLENSEAQEASQALLEDEGNFIDFSRSALWFEVEHPVISPAGEIVARDTSTLLKGYYVGPVAPGLSREAAQSHWIAVHGGLARQYDQFLPFERYIQCHRVDSPLEAALREARDGMPDYPGIGHAETWLDRRSMALAAGPEVEEAFPLLAQDIATFIDTSKARVFVAKEHVVVNTRIFTDPLPQPA